jgi:hypothetical protein
MQLELNEVERQELVQLVRAAHDESSSEIHHAMDHNTRESLRERRSILEALLKRLNGKLQPSK